MESKTIAETISRLAITGLTNDSRVFVKVPDARKHLYAGLQYFVGKNEAKWTSNYDIVADWLTDNRGMGLSLLGNCGTGKSLIGGKVIPVLMYHYCKQLMCFQYQAQDINRKADEILRQKIIYIDDVGTEGVMNSFGNKRNVFPEIVDAAERHGKLLILSSNLDKEHLLEKYGERTLDRLKAITKLVMFRGNSMRVAK